MLNLMNNNGKKPNTPTKKKKPNNVSFCQFKNQLFGGLLQNQFSLQNGISRVNDPLFALKLTVKRKS